MSFSPCRHCGTNHHGARDRSRCAESCRELIHGNEDLVSAAEATIATLQAEIADKRGEIAILKAIESGHATECLLCKGRGRVVHVERGERQCDYCAGVGLVVNRPWKPSGLNNWNNNLSRSPFGRS